MMTFLDRLKKRAKDDAYAAWCLSWAYEEGYVQYGKRRIALRRNKRQRFRWTLRSAELGNVDEMIRLALYLSKGEGCVKNIHEGIMWEKKAYSMGHHLAAYNQGCSYRMLHQYREAYQWFKKTYVHDKEAAVDIGKCYLFGQGVKKNPAVALRYFREAVNVIDDPFYKTYAMRLIADIRCQRPPTPNPLCLRYMALSDIEKLAACYKDELRRNPDNEAAHFCLAQLYFYHKRYREALPHLRKCVQLSFYFEEDVVIRWLAPTYYNLGMLKDEIELYQSYLKQYPKNQWAARFLKLALEDEKAKALA